MTLAYDVIVPSGEKYVGSRLARDVVVAWVRGMEKRSRRTKASIARGTCKTIEGQARFSQQ